MPPTDSRYSCDTCGRSYSNKRNLNRHMKEKHSDSLLHFKCPVYNCTSKFLRRSYICKHLCKNHQMSNAAAKKMVQDILLESEDCFKKCKPQSSTRPSAELYEDISEDECPYFAPVADTPPTSGPKSTVSATLTSTDVPDSRRPTGYNTVDSVTPVPHMQPPAAAGERDTLTSVTSNNDFDQWLDDVICDNHDFPCADDGEVNSGDITSLGDRIKEQRQQAKSARVDQVDINNNVMTDETMTETIRGDSDEDMGRVERDRSDSDEDMGRVERDRGNSDEDTVRAERDRGDSDEDTGHVEEDPSDPDSVIITDSDTDHNDGNISKTEYISVTLNQTT